MKLACIGASYKFVKHVINDLILSGKFEDTKVIVMDIDKNALDIVVGACKSIIRNRGSKIQISSSMDRRETLKNADFVFTAIGVGGFKLWQQEIAVCLENGITQVIGDTIGPAALSKSLRTIPIMISIAKDMEKYCPDAWLINVTNPMTTTVKAVSAYTNTKVVGLCHGSLEIIEMIADLYNVESGEVSFDAIGVNHFTFSNNISVKGRNVTGTLYEDAVGSKSDKLHNWRLGREFFKLFGGWLPFIDDRHLVEFFPYYITGTKNDGDKYGEGPLDFSQRLKRRAEMEQNHKDLASGKIVQEKPYRYSGEDIHHIIMSLYYGTEGTHIVNIPNRGYCPELKDSTVLEMPAVISKDKITGKSIKPGTLDPHIISILYRLNTIYDYTVEAAVKGDMTKLRQALLLDPLLQNHNIVEIIPKLMDKFIEINRKFMPEHLTY